MGRYRAKHELKRGLYVTASIAGRALGRRSLGDDEVRVLMYHKVTDARPNTISVRVDAFRRQQEILRRDCRVVSPDELEAALGEPSSGGPRRVVITFDDGYRDNLLNAYPILKALGHRGFIFIPIDFVGGRHLPHDGGLSTQNPTLDWSELESISDVLEIGSHGCSHVPLTRMSFADARREIEMSKKILEDRLQRSVRAFSYPKGTPEDFSSDLEGVVAEAGYDFCFTTVPGGNRSPSNRFRLERVNVEDFGDFYFRALINGSADVVGFKDTPTGLHWKRRVNRVFRTG